jgi:hypothetical protein
LQPPAVFLEAISFDLPFRVCSFQPQNETDIRWEPTTTTKKTNKKTNKRFLLLKSSARLCRALMRSTQHCWFRNHFVSIIHKSYVKQQLLGKRGTEAVTASSYMQVWHQLGHQVKLFRPVHIYRQTTYVFLRK